MVNTNFALETANSSNLRKNRQMTTLKKCIPNNGSTKGQLISKCPFGVIVWTKIATKKFPRFLP